ncbi:MAG: hypothetical protein ACT6S0_23190 [Roseateles sp.]|uniref:hypothetical protein n=1 Tax=Roseateles sp. TaxID=1971397 RepID=UPI004035FAA8
MSAQHTPARGASRLVEQPGLFHPASLATTVVTPTAPLLKPHAWPYPGLTPEDSARAAWGISSEYADMLAAVVQSQAGAELTSGQVLALIPADWRALMGDWVHASLCPRQGEERGIEVRYVHHDGGGHHFTYQAVEDHHFIATGSAS